MSFFDLGSLESVEYVKDVYDWLRRLEEQQVLPSQFQYSTTIRDRVIEKIFTFESLFKVHTESSFLAITYVDYYLYNCILIEEIDANLLTANALLLAAKTEEINPPSMCFIAWMLNRSLHDCISMEILLLRSLDFHCIRPTAYTFLSIYQTVDGFSSQYLNECVAFLKTFIKKKLHSTICCCSCNSSLNNR